MARVRFNIPSPQADKTAKYERFRGADFSTDPSQVDESRSPWPKNLISDAGGFPEKRPGWRAVRDLGAAIHGLYRLDAGEEIHFLAHAGDCLYRWFPDEDREPALLFGGISSNRSTGFVMGGRLWLLTGNEYLVYGEFSSPDAAGGEPAASYQVKNVCDIATVPVTWISRPPAGGGEQYEAVNLLGRQRENDFLADGTSKVYQLDAAPIDSVDRVAVNGVTLTDGYTVDLTAGTVTFLTAPAKPQDAGGVAGADNVMITYSRTVEGYAERITGCTIAALFGAGTADRVFFSGNPGYPNQDWYSGWSDPAYVADLSYSQVGSEETAIMGYLPIADHLAIIKEDNSQDATVFLRSVEIDSSGEIKFRVRQGVQSVGAISKYCFASLRDDPLFLSRHGVHAVSTVTVTLERTVRRRSGLIDPRLTAEPNLSEAVGCVWGTWYVLAVNGRCYVADSKQQAQKGSIADNYMYEWYYWEGIPARVLFEYDNELYFGTAQGKICKFNTDLDGMNRFSDDGAPIVAEWATKADDDGDFMRYKTMIRRGCGVLIKPYTSSSIKVLVRTDRDFGVQIRKSGMSIFDFADLDFENFSFHTSDAPQVLPFNKKVKKYKTMQIIVRNGQNNQGFGVYGIIKRFRVGNYVK